MKIKRLIRNGNVHEYTEKLYDDEYYYNISATIYGSLCEIVVSKSGVSVYFHDGSCLTTNMRPGGMFPGENKLKKRHLLRVMNTLVSTNYEGKSFSPQEVRAFYSKYLREYNDGI
jgi:hypothetical protein